MLTSLSLPTTLNASDHNLADDFFVPILKMARRYDRGVGYFSSGWLKTVSAGLVTFADNEGQMRLLASPVLDAEDWAVMEIGEAARYDRLLHDVLKRNIDDLAQTLAGDTLSALAWMIADGVITLRLAQPVNKLEGSRRMRGMRLFVRRLNGHFPFLATQDSSLCINRSGCCYGILFVLVGYWFGMRQLQR